MRELIVTKSENATRALARKVARLFVGGEVIALTGDLGAGKTVFAKGIAEGLHVTGIVNSPTFVIMKVYEMNHAKIKYFVHIDCYRLGRSHDLSDIGVSDYMGQDSSVVVIEWAEKVKRLIPKDAIRITIKIRQNGKREIRIMTRKVAKI